MLPASFASVKRAKSTVSLIDPTLYKRGWTEDQIKREETAGVKTNLLFFTKGRPTERTWYYDLSDLKVGKKTPFTVEKFGDFFELLKTRADSPRSWTVDRKAINAKNYHLKAVNPNAPDDADRRTPEELLAIIDAKGREVEEALAVLRGMI